MAETTNSTQKKMSIRHRIIRICKWLLVIFLLLFASNWICSAIYARKNERIVRDFYDQVGASSLSAWVGDLGADPVSGNAWYLYMASLACISEDTREAHDIHDEDADPELAPDARSRREAELDRAHRLIEEARSLPRSISVLNYTHPITMELPQLLPLTSYTRVALASAREHRKAGDIERMRERLVDALHVSQGVLGQPVLISHLVTVGVLKQIETEIVAALPDLPDADLAILDELLEGVNLRQAMKEAMTGEVFFGLRTWNLGSQAAMLDIGYPSLCLFEIDRSYYLDRMIPIALDPESEEALENFRRPVPGYAILSRMVIRVLNSLFDGQSAARVCLDLTRESLQREAKRRRGEEFDYPSPNEHITIEKTKNGVRLYSPLLRAFGDPKKALEATIGGRS